MKKNPFIKTLIIILCVGLIAIISYRLIQVDTSEPIEQITSVTASRADLIDLYEPAPDSEISSPLKISGQARGYWFFEASFPVILTDWDGLIIAEGYATAQGDWMTEDYVPFTATLEFTKPAYGERGSLILKKDNPSGLPEHDDALEIGIRFK